MEFLFFKHYLGMTHKKLNLNVEQIASWLDKIMNSSTLKYLP